MILRLFKVFIVSLVAIYSFVNGPRFYSDIEYMLANISFPGGGESSSDVSSVAFAKVKPRNLPVSAVQAPIVTPNINSQSQQNYILWTPVATPIVEEIPLPSNATITIEKIGVSVPIVFNVPPVTEDIYNNLTNGMVHYSSSVKPGISGAAVILCHSSLYPWQVNKYGAPCAKIGKIEVGDKIEVKYEDGRTFNFRMTKSIVFNPLDAENDPRVSELENVSRPNIVLVTCWPINKTEKRFALQAELE